MTSLGIARPSSRLLRQCDEYAKEILGSIKYSPWLKAYATFSGTFKEGWIPDDYYGKVVVPRLNGSYGRLSKCRSIASRLLQTESLPDLAYSINGLLHTISMDAIQPTELKKYLFAACDKVVYKMDNTKEGGGIFIYDVDSFPDESITFSNGVFQRYVAQHPFFDAFTNQAVSTVRITTVVDDESNVSCCAAFLRLPRCADTHVKSATEIDVAVSLHGELHEKGYLPSWAPVTSHPDSGKAFANQILPHFQGCVRKCVSLHESMSFARVIGWDVIPDVDGNVVLMEWNGYPDIIFSEVASGPCFADLGWQNLWRN